MMIVKMSWDVSNFMNSIKRMKIFKLNLLVKKALHGQKE
jgi:hypothetical protein